MFALKFFEKPGSLTTDLPHGKCSPPHLLLTSYHPIPSLLPFADTVFECPVLGYRAVVSSPVRLFSERQPSFIFLSA